MKKFMLFTAIALLLTGLMPTNAQAALHHSDLVSQTAILIDADTGQILYEKHAHQRMYPASTTKIMTALLVCEYGNPNDWLTATQTALAIDEPESASIYLQVEERLQVEHALYGLMLPSANDAANVLAEYVAGSQEEFCRMMNERAREIGALDTHFANPNGLHEDDHYTTAYDMALITRKAMENEDFLEYFAAPRYVMPETNVLEYERFFTNKHHMLVPEHAYYYPDAIGGKVGYTLEAKQTLSTAAQRDGRTLICVVMKANHWYEKFDDTILMLEYGFDHYKEVTLSQDEFETITVPLEQDGASIGQAVFSYDKDYTLLLHEDIHPSAVEISYDAPAVYDIDNPVECAVTLRLDDSITIEGMPKDLVTFSIIPTLEVDVVPVSAGVLEEEPQFIPLSLPAVVPPAAAVPDSNGIAPILYLLLVIPAVGLVFLVILIVRRVRESQKRKLTIINAQKTRGSITGYSGEGPNS